MARRQAHRLDDPHRRDVLKAGLGGSLGVGFQAWAQGAWSLDRPEEQALYNGIRLPKPWPPRLAGFTHEPMAPPYLAAPPAVIPIEVGRQLFVDDFLIEQTSLQRTYHLTKYHPATPVLKPDKPWEKEGGPTAMVFSDGVWYDPKDRLFKMWYMGGLTRATCLAQSQDGIRWEKPALDVKTGTNIVQAEPRDSVTVWLDHAEKDPKRRFKMARSWRLAKGWGLHLYVSADGIHWGDAAATSGPCGDRTTIFYNPFRKVWVYSLRGDAGGMGRVRHYWAHSDLIAGAKWQADEPSPWIGADRLDGRRDDLQTTPQLYNLDAVAYESLLLGLFTIWRGQPKDRAKPNEVCIGFSRDGFHWHRPDHRAFIPVSETHSDWNWGNVQSAGGGCLLVGDRLYFYVSGRAGVRGSPASGVCSTGLAILRRDGFASMDADKQEGTLTTRPVRFKGGHFFVNVDASKGELRVEVLNAKGEVVEPFSRARCLPIRADQTRQAVTWTGESDLARLAGRSVRFRFYLTAGRLYAFWVSAAQSGASGGYVAAGGPAFTGPMDAPTRS
jgi:hypothetical protein